jgi:hypothetical protein
LKTLTHEQKKINWNIYDLALGLREWLYKDFIISGLTESVTALSAGQ